MKYLGIDYGTKRVGIATSDDGGSIAFPKIVLPTAHAEDFLVTLVAQEKIELIVMGESKNNNGEENAVMQGESGAREFARRMSARTGVDVVWEWEGYSTGVARNAAHEVRRTDGTARTDAARKVGLEREVVDAGAAAVILQSYLDRTAQATG